MPGHHHHLPPDAGDRRVILAVLVNLVLTLAQIVGGILSGSLALIADAIHNLSDAISLAIAFIARKIARYPADGNMTFGYMRAEIVAALVNYTTLIVVGIYLVYEAVLRFFDPQSVDGWLVVIIAGVALAVDAVTAALTYTLSKSSMNIRAAFLHNVADAIGSIAVIVAGTLILLYDWRLVDPLVTLLIAGYILWMALSEIGGAIRILMLGSPPDLDTSTVVAAVESVDGVSDMHHVHLWQMEEHRNSLEAHLTIHEGRWPDADRIKANVRTVIKERFEIEHSILELECSNHACNDAPKIGHGDHEHQHAQTA